MRYGGDYNPEQWPAEVHDEDVALMREAGITAVTVGVFAWSSLEPEPGRYDFRRLDDTMERLRTAGVGVVLATPTASPPPWFSLAHPEALTVGADGIRLTHGSRDTYCASAPAYRAAARRIATELAARYATHPALDMWHVHNEYGTGCHCDLAAAAFRDWLRSHYEDLGALNDAWTTAFWGQGYSSWDEIMPPRRTQYLHNPAQLLDFRRFTSDELLSAYREQRDVLRSANPGVPITTNFVLGDWVPVDHARWAREVDLVAIDHYPADAGAGAEEEAAFAADQARGWSRTAFALLTPTHHPPRRPGDGGGTGGGAYRYAEQSGEKWLLMETAPNLIYTAGRMHAKEAGRMARQAVAAVARGSGGAMYFQWRAPRGGAERFHSALVPHAGAGSRVFREAVALGAQLARLGAVEEAAVEARIAIVHDEPSAWALRGPGMPRDDLDGLDAARRAHRELWRRGYTADVLGGLEVLDAYRMVVLPMHFLLEDAQARALTGWVEAGGRLVVTFLSGIADRHGRVHLGGHPGPLRDLLGLRVEEWMPMAPGETVALGDHLEGEWWRETVRLEGAAAVARYPDGGPAIARHAVGAGSAWYVSTRLTGGDLLATVAGEAGVAPVIAGVPPGVEVVRRGRWLFVLNHTGSPCELPANGTELLTGAVVRDRLRIEAGGVAVVES